MEPTFCWSLRHRTVVVPVCLVVALLHNVFAANLDAPEEPPIPLKDWQQHRQLQDPISPCAAIAYDDAVLPSEDLAVDFFKPSFIEQCLASQSVNQTLLYSHIANLKETFQQYYCFYDIASNASDSNPISFQPELGYSVFSGPLAGQVDLTEEIGALLETVESGAASLATFWDLQTISNKLFDAHVSLPRLAGVAGELADLHLLNIFPDRNLDPSRRIARTWMRPSYLKDGEFQLKVIWESYDGNQTEDIVVSMNDMAPYDFVLDLVSKPEAAINFPYQSIGARMNGAFKRLETSSSRAPEGVVFTIGSRSRPTSILPDAFVVAYASGESETYFSGLRYRGLNTSTVYDLLNSNNLDLDTPGSAYQNFQIAVSQILDVTATTKDAQQRKSTPKTTDVELEVLKQVGGDDTGYQFDEVINLRSQLSGERMDVAAYKIHDEFAVLKIESFAFEADDDGNPAMISIWSNFTAAAKENGVTKAMIDISGNGGGVITSGYQLAVSLFPFAPYKVFERQFDVTYNSVMLAYNDTVSPVMDSLKLEVNLLTDTQLEAYIEASPTSTGELVSSMIESLLGFCCNDILLETCQNLQRCFPLFDLSVSAQTMNQFPSAPQMRSFLQQLTEAFDEYNPFNVLQTLQRGFVDPNKIHKVVRGGQVVNLTNQFTILEEQLYYEAAAQAFQNDFFFDEVVIVSDGAAGSTACIFSSMVMQLWKNRDAWEGREVPITTITYGGTKEPSDTTVAGFPASVQQVNIGYPIITSGLLYMLEFLLPPALSVLLTNVNSYYQSLLPVPPYFAESLPQMPVFNYYSNFMQPGAIPLQFVKIVADKHLPQIFNHNSLASTSGLETLYEEAAKLGFTTDTVVEESEDETHDVVAERKRFEPGGRQ